MGDRPQLELVDPKRDVAVPKATAAHERRWYVLDQGRVLGPVREGELLDRIAARFLPATAWVCPVGYERWQQICAVPFLRGTAELAAIEQRRHAPAAPPLAASTPIRWPTWPWHLASLAVLLGIGLGVLMVVASDANVMWPVLGLRVAASAALAWAMLIDRPKAIARMLIAALVLVGSSAAFAITDEDLISAVIADAALASCLVFAAARLASTLADHQHRMLLQLRAWQRAQNPTPPLVPTWLVAAGLTVGIGSVLLFAVLFLLMLGGLP